MHSPGEIEKRKVEEVSAHGHEESFSMKLKSEKVAFKVTSIKNGEVQITVNVGDGAKEIRTVHTLGLGDGVVFQQDLEFTENNIESTPSIRNTHNQMKFMRSDGIATVELSSDGSVDASLSKNLGYPF